jgi:hypothetical protein
MTTEAEAADIHAAGARPGYQQEPPAEGQAGAPGSGPASDAYDEVIIDRDPAVAEDDGDDGDDDEPSDLADDRPGDTDEDGEDEEPWVVADDATELAGHAPAPASPVAKDAGAGETRRRWAAIQSSFVDDPHTSVAEAAAFAAEVIDTLVASARQRESELRGEWDHDGADTESLRHTLRSYRGLLERIAAL